MIKKGTKGQKGIRFRVRNMFMFLDSQTHSRIKDSQMNADLCADAEHCLFNQLLIYIRNVYFES